MTKRKIVTLCGSTKFFEAFMRANYEETMKGNVVLSVGFFMHRADVLPVVRTLHGEEVGCTPEQKVELDKLHFDKIEMSDEILVLNVAGYVGESTRREIGYALAKNKKVRFLEPEAGEKFLLDNSHQLGQEVAEFLGRI